MQYYLMRLFAFYCYRFFIAVNYINAIDYIRLYFYRRFVLRIENSQKFYCTVVRNYSLISSTKT